MTTRTMLKAFLTLMAAVLAAEVALVGLVEATAAVRRRGQKPPPEAFPWEEQSEVKLESGSRLKLYPEHEGLYEAMIEEIEGAQERIFVETFIWQADGWGRRFVGGPREEGPRGGRGLRRLRRAREPRTAGTVQAVSRRDQPTTFPRVLRTFERR